MTLSLIDGDVIAHMACEPRNLKRTATGEMLRLVKLEPEVFTPEEDAIYLEGAWKRFQEIVTEIEEIAFSNLRKIAIKGDWNFRDRIFPEYKINRNKRPDRKNIFVPQLRKRAAEAGMAVEAHGMEADDLIRIWQQECVANDQDYAIFSIDKDLRCIPGAHYLLHKNQWLNVTEDMATRFYYEQLLKGDPTDNIRGIPGVGPVKAEKFLENCDNEKDMQIVVQACYQAAFGEDWKKELQLTGDLVYLLKHKADKFSCDDWPVVEDLPEETVVPTTQATPVNFDFKKHWPKAEFTLNPILPEKEKDEFIVTSTVPIPIFNPNWGKKHEQAP